MYEGKNIHYSQVDNKPLCSSSRKICRQRRLNGYAFCVRHILEDPSAPFKSCEFITRSKLPCSNPIPKDDSRQYVSLTGSIAKRQTNVQPKVDVTNRLMYGRVGSGGYHQSSDGSRIFKTWAPALNFKNCIKLKEIRPGECL